jgi:hypothetical protein
MMHNLMVGMFWGGVVMALPPVALGIGVLVFVVRKERQSKGRGHEGIE